MFRWPPQSLKKVINNKNPFPHLPFSLVDWLACPLLYTNVVVIFSAQICTEITGANRQLPCLPYTFIGWLIHTVQIIAWSITHFLPHNVKASEKILKSAKWVWKIEKNNLFNLRALSWDQMNNYYHSQVWWLGRSNLNNLQALNSRSDLSIDFSCQCAKICRFNFISTFRMDPPWQLYKLIRAKLDDWWWQSANARFL